MAGDSGVLVSNYGIGIGSKQVLRARTNGDKKGARERMGGKEKRERLGYERDIVQR